jgi:hypothetical protein
VRDQRDIIDAEYRIIKKPRRERRWRIYMVDGWYWLPIVAGVIALVNHLGR